MPLWTKIRLWTSPAFFRNVVLTKVREFFAKLLDVKPKSRQDYYSVFRWLISKRLAFALVVGLAICALIYIAMMLPSGFLTKSQGDVRNYKYRSLPLKFYSGQVNILDREGRLAYSGQVEKGAATGVGALYYNSGSLLYEGDFLASMYDGTGTLYYENEVPRYSGTFTENHFNGAGKYYRANGVLEYEGDYINDVRTGQGKLYNGAGNQIYDGAFLNNEIVYYGFISRPTTDLSVSYTGQSLIYQSDREYCVAMPEINAVCTVEDGSTSLENEWIVSGVYVLDDSISLEGDNYSTINQLTSALGQPLYFGSAWVTLGEAVAINQMNSLGNTELGKVNISSVSTFDEVFDVSDYDKNYEVYLYTYEKDDLLYTFYTAGAGRSDFLMYEISQA